MNKNSRIYIAGEDSLLGQAIKKSLNADNYSHLINGRNFNLTDRSAVQKFFKKNKPEYVFLVAQKSGGIIANIKQPADFIYENILIQTNIINGAVSVGVKKILYLAASCVYPKNAFQPIKEESFMDGRVEETSIAYAISKIAGVETCRAFSKQYGLDYVAVVPATVYGPGGHINPKESHVLQALLGKFLGAIKNKEKKVIVWGSGKPKREFIYIDDLSQACIHLMTVKGSNGIVNVGSGEEVSIKELAEIIGKITGFHGKISFDLDKPDGAMRKLLDSSKIIKTGWRAKTPLEKGINMTYKWYIRNY